MLQALEDALASGEPLNAALGRLGVHRSTLSREKQRDDAVRSRIDRALAAGRAEAWRGSPAELDPRRAMAVESSNAAPRARARVVDTSASVSDEQPAPALAASPNRGSGGGHLGRSQPTSSGSGSLVFGPKRPRPLKRLRRIALHGAQPGMTMRSDPDDERLAAHRWLPGMLLLAANLVLALVATSSLTLVAAVAAVVVAYAALVLWSPRAWARWSRRGTLLGQGSGGHSPRLIGGQPVRGDLRWLRDTIGEPMPGQARPPTARGRRRG